MAQVRASQNVPTYKTSFKRHSIHLFELTNSTLENHIIPQHMDFGQFEEEAKSLLLLDEKNMMIAMEAIAQKGGSKLKKGGIMVDLALHFDTIVGISGTGAPSWVLSVRTRMMGNTRRVATVVCEPCHGLVILNISIYVHSTYALCLEANCPHGGYHNNKAFDQGKEWAFDGHVLRDANSPAMINVAPPINYYKGGIVASLKSTLPEVPSTNFTKYLAKTLQVDLPLLAQ